MDIRATSAALLALALLVVVTPGRAAVLCRTRGDTVKVREVCKPRETTLDPATLGVWRSAPIKSSLEQRFLAKGTFNTTFAFSPPCDVAGGDRVTGGGCLCDTVGKLTETRDSSPGWFCACDQPDTIVAYVICTKVRVAVCGNGVVDPPGEQCDGGDVAGCGPGEYECTPSCTCRPRQATRCCQSSSPAFSYCFDAAPADAEVKCPLIEGASLAPLGQLCDGSTGRCGPERRPGSHCCECPVASPPYPHSRLCLDVAPGAEFDCQVLGCTRTVGAQCGPLSETCGGP